MSDFSLTLVLRFKTSKIAHDMAKVSIKSERITPFGGIFHVRKLFSRFVGPVIDKLLQVPYGQVGHKSLRTEEDKPHQSLRVQVLCKQSGIAERISVPAKWIRTARHYQLNIYTDNKSYQNPFAFTDG